MRLNGLGKNREIDGEHDEDCDEDGFQLARGKFDRGGEGGSEAVGMEYYSINLRDGSELKLA